LTIVTYLQVKVTGKPIFRWKVILLQQMTLWKISLVSSNSWQLWTFMQHSSN